jgi:hypothetical protein
MTTSEHSGPDRFRPTSPYDTLDAEGACAVLQINDRRTLTRLIDEEDLPVHRIGNRGGVGDRVFIRGELLAWIKSRCTPARPGKSTDDVEAVA